MKYILLADVSKFLETLGEVWVFFEKYQITHGYLNLHLGRDGFRPKVATIHLIGCSYVCGPTTGGPWRLQVEEEAGPEGTRVVLRAGEAFIAKAERVQAEPVET
jgi:hypothetical protein